MNKCYDVRKTAELLGIKVVTVRKWIREGKINAKQITGTSRWIITEDEIKRLRGEQ